MKFNQAQLELIAAGASMEAVMAAATPGETLPENDNGQIAAINAEVAAQLATSLGTIETMTAEAATASAAVVEANAKVIAAEAAVAAAEAVSTSLFAAVHERACTLSVALNKTKPAADMSAADLAALATSLNTEFMANYKPGAATKPTNTADANNKPKTQEQLKADINHRNMLAAAKLLPGA